MDRFVQILIMVTLAILAGLAAWVGVSAQASGLDWGDPVNLSRSGNATVPQLVLDAEGGFHIFWEDEFAGIVYSAGNGETWSEPAAVDFPFGPSLEQVVIISDPTGLLHAAWFEDQGDLRYSNIPAGRVGQVTAWAESFSLAEGVGAVAVDVGPNGDLHLAYLKISDDDGIPAGVYVRSASPPGFAWSAPQLLDQSPYFRGLHDDKARVQVAAGGDGRLYAAWDNPAIERVFLSQSLDGGESWSAPMEVDRREELDGNEAAGPAQVLLHAFGSQALLLWNAGHEGSSCSHYFSASSDGGLSWSPRQPVGDGFQGCPQASQMLDGPGSSILLMSDQDAGVFLRAWDEGSWSSAQLQPILTSFINPDTFRDVILSGHQAVLSADAQLHVAGFDIGAGSDTWLVSRPLETVAAWFPAPDPVSDWSPLVSLSSASDSGITDPVLLAGGQTGLHAMWSQASGEAIVYARPADPSDETAVGGWSSPVPVLLSTAGAAQQPDLAELHDGRLMVVWNADSQALQFSSVESEAALLPERWSQPLSLPAPQPGISHPEIAVNTNGHILVAFAIPLNEQRGIYLLQSPDQGQTWSDPKLIFDAGAAGWEMADQPEMAVSASGRLHLLWKRLAFSSVDLSPLPLELYYAYSDDSGQTWSEPERVTDSPPLSAGMAAWGPDSLMRTWASETDGLPVLFYQVSQDDGSSWSPPARVSELGNERELHSLVPDGSGNVNLLMLREGNLSVDGERPYLLQRLIWDGQKWALEDSLDLGPAPPGALEAVRSADNRLAVLMTRSLEPAVDPSLDEIIFTQRSLPPAVGASEPLPGPTAQTGLAPAVTAQVDAPQTQNFPARPDAAGALAGTGSWFGVALGLTTAGFVIFLLIVIGKLLRRVRSGG